MSHADLMLPGEFGAATRLSPKALRLYAEQGLLVPAHVDPVSGYRRYHRDQVARGRLISRLRALDLPLGRIATLLPLDAPARAAELRGWLAAREDELRRARGLVAALDGGGRTLAQTPALRSRPARKLLSREARVHIVDLEAFEAESLARIRAALATAGVTAQASMLVYFHGLVTHDSDGPVEVAVAFAGSVEPVDDLRVRRQPAGLDAWLPVAKRDAVYPEIIRYYDAIEDWMQERRLADDGSPVEIWPGTDGAPVDVTYPVREVCS